MNTGGWIKNRTRTTLGAGALAPWVVSWAMIALCVAVSARLWAEEPPRESPMPLAPESVAYFELHVRPVLVEHCYSCHSAGDNKQKGGLRLDTREGWAKGGDQGPAIVPGDPNASLVIQAIRYDDSTFQMPPDKPLPKDVVAKLERWVQMGAPDPRDGRESASKTATHPSDPIAGREHWAFLPLATVPVPSPVPFAAAASTPEPAVNPATHNDHSTWPLTPVDAFILDKLNGASLRPVGDADRRTLLRRLSFQLIGLPPSQSDVDEFVADDEPDATSRVVDRLLASPQFGVRWGRHWLDLARYADSNGLDENFLFREAWRYRNWVIRAVNDDVPYDRFLTEQLAGDLLPYGSIEQRDQQRIAAGFLVVGPKVLLGNDPNQRRMDVADEQLDTIGRAVLGQTLGCARCHDHKFDPVPTADYYALAGILTSTQVMQVRFMLNEQRMMEQLVGLGAEGDQLNQTYEKYWRERPGLQQREQHAKGLLEALERDDEKAFDDQAGKHAGEVAEVAKDKGRPKTERVAAQKELLEQLRKQLASPPSIPPRAMIPTDAEKPADEAIRLAGKFDRLGNSVPRGFLRVISDSPASIAEGQSGRIELSRWLTDVESGAGRLAARVLVNRHWHHLMGSGLVRTVDNFGRTGETASHPELLDYLARRQIETGWSRKALVREIALSRVFRLGSELDEAGQSIDPDNRLLWRGPRRRLEPEALRDAMLWAADGMTLSPLDSTVSYLGDQATAVGDNKVRRRTDFPARSVYLPVIRNDLPELFDVFDFANPHASTGARSRTMVPTQGLFILNDHSVMAAAEATARRLLGDPSLSDEARKLDELYRWLFQASPSDEERAEVLAFVSANRQRLVAAGNADTELPTWSLVAHALLASSRFQILD